MSSITKKQLVVIVPNHPSNKKLGKRGILVNTSKICISGDDFHNLKVGQKIRLKYFCTVIIENINPLIAKVVNSELSKKTVQWVPINEK